MVFRVLIESYLKIFLNRFRVWKHEAVIALTRVDMLSLLSMTIPRFLAWVVGVGVGPSSASLQV